MAGTFVESIVEASYHIEDEYARRDAITRKQNRWFHHVHQDFAHHDWSNPNGRPHHVGAWVSGLLAGLGSHRRGPTRQ